MVICGEGQVRGDFKLQDERNAHQEKPHLPSHTGVPSGNGECLEGADRGVGLDKAGWEGGQGPSLCALLRYLACPEGNREPLQGLEQRTHGGRVTRHYDLLASLLLGDGQRAGSSSGWEGPALPNSSPPPHPPAAPMSLKAIL